MRIWQIVSLSLFSATAIIVAIGVLAMINDDASGLGIAVIGFAVCFPIGLQFFLRGKNNDGVSWLQKDIIFK